MNFVFDKTFPFRSQAGTKYADWRELIPPTRALPPKHRERKERGHSHKIIIRRRMKRRKKTHNKMPREGVISKNLNVFVCHTSHNRCVFFSLCKTKTEWNNTRVKKISYHILICAESVTTDDAVAVAHESRNKKTTKSFFFFVFRFIQFHDYPFRILCAHQLVEFIRFRHTTNKQKKKKHSHIGIEHE